MGLLFGTPVDVDGRHVDQLTASQVYLPIGSTSHMTYRQDGRGRASILSVFAVGAMAERLEVVHRKHHAGAILQVLAFGARGLGTVRV
jgi:hypothetical protein